MTRKDTERVVVTGLGAVTPLGNDVPTSWATAVAGCSGAAPITQFDATNLKTQFACEVKGFDATKYVDRREARRMDRFLHFAVASAQEAVADAGLDMTRQDPWRVGALIGSGIGGIHTLLEQVELQRERGASRVSPFCVTALMLNSASAQVSIMLGARGPNLAIATACATGNHAIGEAAWMIRRGDADVMLAGGSESAIVSVAMASFVNMGAISSRNDAPERASRPFDVDRDGFVVAEGAAVLVLERLDKALERGARIYGELLGYAATADAYHVTAPSENGVGAVESMVRALRSAELPPTAVDYINAHGTSTPLNDVVETQAIKTAFGEHAYRVAISSTKSMTGHLMGSAGAVEAVFSLLALRDQVVPPTINLDHPDPGCDLDYVPNVARRMPVNVVMSNSFGFGGHNATVVFGRLP